MKAKILPLLLTVLLISVILPINVEMKRADSDIESLEPNSYQKRDFRENTNFLRENNLNEPRESVPEEQKLITFKQREKKAEEDFLGSLFTTEGEKNTTIQANAEQLNLFKESENTRYQAFGITEDTSEMNSITILLFGFLGIAIIMLLVLILPRMAK
ncbi:hypothetical protein AB685_10795 [Bacillus sp. LL01]|uniref:type VII secretion protein EssA n=1 Tax=Bacillus sp. LL01 TaxID=1665556 RepID=UPI00064CE17B|nr:type VII secretion protein EssA [Bacillus sp. LL01]KMJ58375.1 hypothetical protein AB685_10795 [Bacillus sp. LL01]